MTHQQRHPPTFLLQGFKRHLPLRVVIQVTIMQDLVVQCQAAMPEPLWNTRVANGEARAVLGIGDSCRGGPARTSGRLPGPRCPLTLPPPVPDFSEAAALTQPVQALLLDQLQDLGLDFLPKLPVAHTPKSAERTGWRCSRGRQQAASLTGSPG